MKKIKNISYPTKYNQLISEFGEEVGSEMYYKFIRGASLEKYILKYGEVDGELKYKEYKNKQKNSGVSLEKMILKYGEVEGKLKYDNWKYDTRQDLDGFIRRYGEEEGKQKYESFKNKSYIPLSKLDRNDIPSARQLSYWLLKFDGDEIKATKALKEFQNNSSIDKYIKRYGEDIGTVKYIEDCKKKINNLEGFITKYGMVDGTEKYNDYISKLKMTRTKEAIIEKHGEKYYKELIIKKTNYFTKQYSIIGYDFCNKIYEIVGHEYSKVYYGDNEYMFYAWVDEFKVISVDLYIKDINLVIEFYGDYWHRNPKKYKDVVDGFKEQIWEHDKRRIDILKSKYNCDVIIVWESEYKEDCDNVIKNIIEKINKLKNGIQ